MDNLNGGSSNALVVGAKNCFKSGLGPIPVSRARLLIVVIRAYSICKISYLHTPGKGSVLSPAMSRGSGYPHDRVATEARLRKRYILTKTILSHFST